MKRIRIAVLAAMAALLLVSASAQAQAKDPAAMATGPDIMKTILQAKGKVVVLNFWASWCGPCRQEIPELIELRKRFPEDKLVVLGVSLDQEPAMYKAFSNRMGFNFPIFRAAPDVTETFLIKAIPRTLVYSTKGEMVHAQDGYMQGQELERLVKKYIGS